MKFKVIQWARSPMKNCKRGNNISDIYELCEDCKYAIFHSEDPGFSPKECGLPSRCITYLDGCKKDLDPQYNEEEECVDCEAFEPRSEW